MCFSFRNTLALLALKRSLSLDGIHQANTGSFRTSKLEQQVKSNKGAGDDTFFNLSLVVVNFVVSCLVEETPCEISSFYVFLFYFFQRVSCCTMIVIKTVHRARRPSLWNKVLFLFCGVFVWSFFELYGFSLGAVRHASQLNWKLYIYYVSVFADEYRKQPWVFLPDAC